VDTSIATSVRRARLSDAAALAQLVNRAFSVEQWISDDPRTSADEIAALIASSCVLVLEGTGGIAAVVVVQGLTARSERTPRHAYLGMLSVAPELQGMGLGRRLVRVAEAMAEAGGASAMTLRIMSLREELSRWYRSLGYRETGTSPCTGQALKRPCHFIELAKPLVPAAPRYEVGAMGAA